MIRRWHKPETDEALDHPINLDPDSPIAVEHPWLTDMSTHGMLLEELLGPDEPDAA